MAKGDDKRARNRIDYEKGRSQDSLDNLLTAYTTLQEQGIDRYNSASAQGDKDYGNIMGRYQEFADTGGYSPEDTANMRSRAIAPTRAVYANAVRNVDRQRALQGGYSPGYNALQGRMAREQSQGLSDANTNVEAQLAEMKQRGRLAGISGMNQAFGTIPGMASFYGNQLNQRTGDMLNLQGLQNQLSLGTMGRQNEAAGIKGGWQQGFENVMSGVNTAANVIKPWG